MPPSGVADVVEPRDGQRSSPARSQLQWQLRLILVDLAQARYQPEFDKSQFNQSLNLATCHWQWPRASESSVVWTFNLKLAPPNFNGGCKSRLKPALNFKFKSVKVLAAACSLRAPPGSHTAGPESESKS
jgi:hypothetical protein